MSPHPVDNPVDSALEDALSAAGLDPVDSDAQVTADLALAAAEEALGALRMARKRHLLLLAAIRTTLDERGKAAARRLVQGAIERCFDEMRPPEHQV